ncbi:MAG TPA: ATP-binding protein [Pyrinomonadaceae bacterium]|nr:ATP-binding protein [Pyrinomonadaceae bacterium]
MPDEAKSGGGRVVYSRPGGREGGGAFEGAGGQGPLWQALAPLLVGFALLVTLVIGLGYVSADKVSEIRFSTQQEERALAARLNLLLNLNLALNKLNTEARIRGRLEAAGVMLPPTDLRLRNERDAVRALLPDFDKLPVAGPPERKAEIRRRLDDFIAMTGDLRRYSLEGFGAHQAIERDLDALFEEIDVERDALDERRDAAIERARGEIRLLMWLGALTGLVVATATTLEVWRRFRQMRRGYEALRRERQFSAQMLGGLPSAVAALDREDRIRSANAAFFEVFPGAAVGGSIHDKFTTPEGLALLAAATSSHVSRTTYHGRWRMGGEDGAGPRAFDIYSSPLEIEGEPGQLLTLVDVTEAAEAENELRRQEALAAVGQAAAQVAHEIKNPLGSIRLGVAMLRDMTDNREAITTIDLVERGIEHLSKLTLDVTQFSRRRQLNLGEADLHALLDESLDLVADQLREKQTEVERRYAPESPRGTWDEDQLRQVFVNLLANAVDASPPGAPVTVTTEPAEVSSGARRDGEGRKAVAGARIQIADRGPGMDARTRARIFEPFFTTKKKGTGLGLAIAKQIVEQHGGSIRAESTPGEGTRFTIELPLTAAA